MGDYIAIRVDDENNAEEWWDAAREAAPKIAASLSRNNAAVVTRPVFDALAALPGFEDGPEYAPAALIDCGGEGDKWADVIGDKHGVFESVE